MKKLPSQRGQVLVGIVTTQSDWRLIREQLWYRVPVDTAPRRWPPQYIAFYLPKLFKEEAYSVQYYGKISRIKRVSRAELFPDELDSTKSTRVYYQVFIEKLEKLPNPIISHRLRRIVFISTTHRKLFTASDLNDLFDDSPLEDLLWDQLKRLNIQAERQWYLRAANNSYYLDFALFCENGMINIETDGDRWHNDPARVPEDNRRNNDITSDGWQVLRFNTQQIRKEMASYCVPRITDTVNKLGGLEMLTDAPRKYYSTGDGIVQQMTLFNRKSAYDNEPDE